MLAFALSSIGTDKAPGLHTKKNKYSPRPQGLLNLRITLPDDYGMVVYIYNLGRQHLDNHNIISGIKTEAHYDL